MANDEIRRLDAGTEFGNEFRIVRALGAGGFGITYEVIALRTIEDLVESGRRYAVKEFAPISIVQRGSDGKHLVPRGSSPAEREDNWQKFLMWRTEFESEARTLALMTDGGIANVLLVRSANSTEYFVMEFIEGHSLHDTFKAKWERYKAPLTWPEVQPYVEDLLDALEHVHDHGIVHRDIKPANIMLRNGGEPVLIDFGGARVIDKASENIVHTQGFAPAEQIFGPANHGLIGQYTDIYSLAATFHFVLAAMPPYVVENNEIKFSPRLQDHPLYAKMRIPDRIVQAIESALAFYHPRNRPQSVSKWRAAFGYKRRKRPRVSPGDAEGPERIFRHAERLRSGGDKSADLPGAVHEYQRAADMKYPPALYRLGRLHEAGEGVRRDSRAAHDLYERAAILGHVPAQYRLAKQYLEGDGAKQSNVLGLEYTRKASDQNYPPAMNLLGRLYRKGVGVEQNDRQACKWYRRSARHGNPEAAANLSSMYERGLGVSRDNVMAHRLKGLADRLAVGGKAADEALVEVRRLLQSDQDGTGDA